jgi:hypothetical protein
MLILRPGWRVMRDWVIGAVALLALAAAFCGPFFENGFEGPYTRWYLQRKKAQAVGAHLVGRPMEDVENVLGRADEVTYVPPRTITQADGGIIMAGPPYVRFAYAPYPWIPMEVRFKVYCTHGVVTGLKVNDDFVR